MKKNYQNDNGGKIRESLITFLIGTLRNQEKVKIDLQNQGQKRSQSFCYTLCENLYSVFLTKKHLISTIDIDLHFFFVLSGWQPVVYHYRTQGEEKRKFSGSLWTRRFGQKSFPVFS